MSALRECPGMLALFPDVPIVAPFFATCDDTVGRADYDVFLSLWNVCQRNAGSIHLPAAKFGEVVPRSMYSGRLNPVKGGVVRCWELWRAEAPKEAAWRSVMDSEDMMQL